MDIQHATLRKTQKGLVVKKLHSPHIANIQTFKHPKIQTFEEKQVSPMSHVSHDDLKKGQAYDFPNPIPRLKFANF